MTNEDKPLSKNAKIVQEVLSSKGLSFKVIELSASTRTANDAATTIGCEVAQIIKSLIFKTVKTNQPILVLTSGINRVNEKAIEEVVGEKIAKADANFTKEVTGFAIGGVPPLGHKQMIVTYIDEDLLKFDELWAAAGNANAVFSLRACDIENLTAGKIMSIK